MVQPFLLRLVQLHPYLLRLLQSFLFILQVRFQWVAFLWKVLDIPLLNWQELQSAFQSNQSRFKVGLPSRNHRQCRPALSTS